MLARDPCERVIWPPKVSWPTLSKVAWHLCFGILAGVTHHGQTQLHHDPGTKRKKKGWEHIVPLGGMAPGIPGLPTPPRVPFWGEALVDLSPSCSPGLWSASPSKGSGPLFLPVTMATATRNLKPLPSLAQNAVWASVICGFILSVIPMCWDLWLIY